MPTVTPSPIIGKETAPTKDQLWELAFLLNENWTNFVRITNSFDTVIHNAKSLSEHRWGLIQSPNRILSARSLQYGEDAAKVTRNSAMRGSLARSLVPIWSDITAMTAAPSGATNIKCDTRFRRFADGQRIALVQMDEGRPINFEVVDIVSFTDTDITTTAHAEPLYKKDDVVYPLIEARVSLRPTEGTVRTDDKLSIRIEAKEDIGPMRIPIAGTIGANPAGFPVFDSLPVFDIVPDQRAMRTGVRREGSFAKIGRGYVLEVFGTRGQFTFDIRHIQLNRSDAWDLVQFFESRAGALYPFYFISPTSDMTPVAVTAGRLDVKVVGPEFDWSFVTHIAVVNKDGTFQIRDVAGVIRNGSVDEVTVGTNFSPTPVLADILRASFAHKVRFSSDEMVEDWKTNGVMESRFRMEEILQEKDVTITDLNNTLDEATGEVGATDLQFPGGILFPGFQFDQPWDKVDMTSFGTDGSIYTIISDRAIAIKFLDFDPSNATGSIIIKNVTQNKSKSSSISASPLTNYSNRADYSGDPLVVAAGETLTIEHTAGGFLGSMMANTGAGMGHYPLAEMDIKVRERTAFGRIIATDTGDNLHVFPGMTVQGTGGTVYAFSAVDKIGMKFTPPFPKMTVSGLYGFLYDEFVPGKAIEILAEIRRVSDDALLVSSRIKYPALLAAELDYADGLCMVRFNGNIDLVDTESYRCFFNFQGLPSDAGGGMRGWTAEESTQFDRLSPFKASTFTLIKDTGAGFVEVSGEHLQFGVVASRLFLA